MFFKADYEFKDYFKNNLRQVFLYLIDDCNLRCTQCLYKLEIGFQMQKKEIDYEDAVKLISDFREMGAVKLTLMGGEPTLYGLRKKNKPLLDLIKKSKELGYKYVRIDTNGQFDSELLDRPEFKMLDEITFSIDGPNAEINDPIRGYGAFEKCVGNIKKAKELGYNVDITSCISKELIKRDEKDNLYLDRMIKFAENLGIERINFHNLFKTGVPRDYFSGNLDITINEWFNVWKEIQEKVKNNEYSIPVRMPQSFTTKEKFEENPKYYGYCSCKNSSRILVHPNGMLRVCSLMIGTPYAIARYYDGKIEWDKSNTNELIAHKMNEDTPCTNQFKQNKYGKYVPICVSFKPRQDEFIWNELEWEKRRNEDNKIKIIVGLKDKEIRDNVINIIKKSNFYEIVGIAKDEKDLYEKIINLKSEMVFMQYNYDETDGVEIIKNVSVELGKNVPVFNIIDDNVPKEKKDEVIKLVGNKMNSVIEKKEPYEIMVEDILNEYKEYDCK